MTVSPETQHKDKVRPPPSFPHHLADLALLPAKMFPELLLDNQESQHREGTRTYITVMKWIGRYF